MSPATTGVVLAGAALVAAAAVVVVGSGVVASPPHRGDERQHRERRRWVDGDDARSSAPTVVRLSGSTTEELSILCAMPSMATIGPPVAAAAADSSTADAAVRRARLSDPHHAEGVATAGRWAALLAPDGEVGRIWSLSRPLTYRAIDGLVDKGLITRRGHAAGHGRDRVILAADTWTAAARPGAGSTSLCEHLRDVRTELLVKLAPARARIGLDNEPLLAAQRQVFAPGHRRCSPPVDVDDDLVDLGGVGKAPGPSAASSTRPSVRRASRSQRNQTRKCSSAPATSCTA